MAVAKIKFSYLGRALSVAISFNSEGGFVNYAYADGTLENYFDPTNEQVIALLASYQTDGIIIEYEIDSLITGSKSTYTEAEAPQWAKDLNYFYQTVHGGSGDTGGGQASPTEAVEDYYAAQVHSTAGFKVRRTQRESDGVSVTANAGETIDGWQTVMMTRPPGAPDTIPQIVLENGIWRINGSDGLDAVTAFFAEVFCNSHDHGIQNPATAPVAGLETGVQTPDGSSAGGAVQFGILRTRDGVETEVKVVDADIPAGGGYSDTVSFTIDPLDIADGDTYRLAIRPQPGTNSSADGTGTIYSSFVFVQEASFGAFFGYNSDTAATIFRALRWKQRLTHEINLPVGDIARIIPLDTPIPLAAANEVMIQVRQGARRNYSSPIPIEGIATLYLADPFAVDANALESTASFPEQNQYAISNINPRASIQRGEDVGTKSSTAHVSFGFVFITDASGNAVALWVDDVRIPIAADLSIVQILTR